MPSYDSYCALCGAPWFANIRERPPAGSDHEDNTDGGSELGYSPLKISEDDVLWLRDFRGIGSDQNQKYVNSSVTRDLKEFNVNQADRCIDAL